MNKIINTFLISIILICLIILYYPYLDNQIYLGGEGLFTLDYNYFSIGISCSGLAIPIISLSSFSKGRISDNSSLVWLTK